VDECQDINATRLELIGRMLKPGGTLIAVGDINQAIFGFTGADDKAIEKIKERFQPKEFNLTYSRRCSKAVIRHAQKIVPTIKAMPEAPEGSVTKLDEPTFYMKMRMEDHSKDAVLCRKNAPLMSLAVQLLNQDVPVRFEGTDQMKQLQGIIKRMEASNVADLLVKLNQHQKIQAVKLSPYAYEKLEDQLDSIRYFAIGFNITKLSELEARM
jgi:superfamily I DNA/RNA helicase